MTKLLPATLIAALVASSTALANSVAAPGFSVGDTLGTDESVITQTLEAAGYRDIEFETEDGVLEVEAIHDGQEIEFEVSADDGKILEIEIDDDADDSDKS
ncbi:MAG: PepSY domain-containing protein [Rhizobiaceae bacterium]